MKVNAEGYLSVLLASWGFQVFVFWVVLYLCGELHNFPTEDPECILYNQQASYSHAHCYEFDWKYQLL